MDARFRPEVDLPSGKVSSRGHGTTIRRRGLPRRLAELREFARRGRNRSRAAHDAEQHREAGDRIPHLE